MIGTGPEHHTDDVEGPRPDHDVDLTLGQPPQHMPETEPARHGVAARVSAPGTLEPLDATRGDKDVPRGRIDDRPSAARVDDGALDHDTRGERDADQITTADPLEKVQPCALGEGDLGRQLLLVHGHLGSKLRLEIIEEVQPAHDPTVPHLSQHCHSLYPQSHP